MSPCTIFDKRASTIPKNNAIRKTTTTTTVVPPIASFFEGQVTFFTSTLTSDKNFVAFDIINNPIN